RAAEAAPLGRFPAGTADDRVLAGPTQPSARPPALLQGRGCLAAGAAGSLSLLRMKKAGICRPFLLLRHYNSMDRMSPSSSPSRLVNWAAAAPLMARWS